MEIGRLAPLCCCLFVLLALLASTLEGEEATDKTCQPKSNFHEGEVGSVGIGVAGGVGGGGCVGINEIQAMIAARIDKNISVVNHLILNQQKQIQHQDQKIAELQDRFTKMHDEKAVADINSLDVRITQLHTDLRNIKFLKEGSSWDDTFQNISQRLEQLENQIRDLDIQIEAIQKNLVISSTCTGNVYKQPSGLEADLFKLQEDIVLLKTVLGVSSDSNQGGTLATLQQRLADLENSIIGEEKNTQFAFDVSEASEDVTLLRSSIEKLSTSVSAVEKVVSAANLDNLQSDVTNLTTVFQQLQLDLIKCCKNGMNTTDGVNLQVIGNMVNDMLLLNNADKTGMVDFALESAGGSIINTRCSKTYTPKTGLLSIFGFPLWYSSSSPRMVIQPDMNPGNCWALVGTQGYVVIQLSNFVKITSFSMEHIPKSLSPTGNIDSAPNNFSVVGLAHEYDSEGTELGRYNYDQNGSPIQFFVVQ
ncbi:SUN domain-containing protein 1-like, partial [Anneissia japonica]|uniref:SUN domain-containing protein 1-like n=1 Tax=Anneissia japonica TaxID=1529436 RepID=UPI001425AC70